MLPSADHPCWRLLTMLIPSLVLCFALSPYSGLYKAWAPGDIFTVLAVLASIAGVQFAPFRRAGGNDPPSTS